MRLPGYCTGCRHVKPAVRVSPSEMSRAAARGSHTYSGICPQCEDAQRPAQPDGRCAWCSRRVGRNEWFCGDEHRDLFARMHRRHPKFMTRGELDAARRRHPVR